MVKRKEAGPNLIKKTLERKLGRKKTYYGNKVWNALDMIWFEMVSIYKSGKMAGQVEI